MRRVLTYGLAGLLAAAPLRFGAVESRATSALLAATFLLGAVWIVWRARCGRPPVPWRDPACVAGALLVLFALLQTVPWPRAALERLSPHAVSLRQRYEPASGADAAPAGGGPISLVPWATRAAALRLLAYWIALLVALDLAAFVTSRDLLAGAVAASGAFQAIYGLAESLSGHQHIFAFVKVHDADVATGTFINRNHYSDYLGMTLPMLVALGAMSVARLAGGDGPLRRRLAGAPGREIFRAALLLLAALLALVALFESRSRSGIASALLAMGSVGLVLAWRGKGKAYLAAAGLVAGAALLLLGQAGVGGALVDRFLGAGADFRAGVGRLAIWSQAAGALRSFVLVGSGLGTFPRLFPAFRVGGEGVLLDHAHNDLLEYAVETGVAGLLLLLASALLLRRAARGRWVVPGPAAFLRGAALGSVAVIALHSLTDFNLAIPSNALTAAALLGLAIGCGRPGSPLLLPKEEPARRAPIAPAIAPAAALVAAAFLALSPWGAGGWPGPSTGAPFLAAWGPSDRPFAAAAAIAARAFADLQVLARGRAVGQVPSRESADYVVTRLDDAIALQTVGLRQEPISSKGHLGLGEMKGARCLAIGLERDEEADCVTPALAEFGLGLELNPASIDASARVATYLVSSWPLMDEEERARSRPFIERALRLGGGGETLRRAWEEAQAGA